MGQVSRSKSRRYRRPEVAKKRESILALLTLIGGHVSEVREHNVDYPIHQIIVVLTDAHQTVPAATTVRRAAEPAGLRGHGHC